MLKRAKRPHRTGSLKSANSAKIAHMSECEGKSQKLTSHARLIKTIRDGVENSLPEILANFRGPVSIGDEYHGNLPQVGLSNQQQPHGGCDRDMRGIQSAFNPHCGQAEGRPLVLRIWRSACWQVIQSYYGKHATPIKLAMQLGG
jgi:hypothetical protein